LVIFPFQEIEVKLKLVVILPYAGAVDELDQASAGTAELVGSL